MNSNYVKKCADFLQNIPANKLAATNIAAAGVAVAQTDPCPQEPQSKPEPIGNRAARRPSQRAGGVAGKKRPVWRHPAAGPVVPFPRPQQISHASDQHKFVRSCCPSRRPDTRPLAGARARVDCHWDVRGGKHTPPPAPALGSPAPPCDMIEDPIRAGRGDADNVNHRDGIGQTSVRTGTAGVTGSGVTEECPDRQPLPWSGMLLSEAHPLPAVSGRKDRQPPFEDFTDCSSVDNLELQKVDQTTNQLFQFHPLKTLQFLCLELTNKLRALGPDHRSLYKLGKELSIVVRFLSQQQPNKDHPEATVTDGTKRTQDKPECPNCQLLQQNCHDERDRHAQESAQLTEQINYLQTQLKAAPTPKNVMSELVREQYSRMENDITKLKLAVDQKNVELVLINDLKRNLKEAHHKAKRIEQERAELEKRLLEVQMENKRLELFLDTQAINFRKVKSELNHIHQLSSKQIQYLDEPIESLVQLVSPHRHRHPSLRNYATAQSSECDTTSSLTATIQSRHSLEASLNNRTVKSCPSNPEMDRTKRKSHSRLERGTTTTTTSSVAPDESMPSLASQSDRNNATGSSSTPHGCWPAADDNGKDNECADQRHRQAPGINRADHDDNRIRHRASDSDYSTGKLTAPAHRSADDAAEVSAKWHQFVVELADNITLPSSPRPYRHNLSIAQLSDLDDSLTSDAALAGCRTTSAQGSSSSSKFTKQLQTK